MSVSLRKPLQMKITTSYDVYTIEVPTTGDVTTDLNVAFHTLVYTIDPMYIECVTINGIEYDVRNDSLVRTTKVGH